MRIKLLGVAAIAVTMVATPAWALPGGVPDHGASANSHVVRHQRRPSLHQPRRRRDLDGPITAAGRYAGLRPGAWLTTRG